MKILAIETSCDETAVCLIEASGSFDSNFQFKVLGNALLSQIAVHAPYGGVFPNLAKREHSRNLVPLLKQVLEQSAGAQGGNCARSNLRQTAQGRAQGRTFTRRGLTSGVDVTLLKSVLEREPELFEQLETFLKTHGKPNVDAIAVTHGPGLEPALWVGVNFARALSAVWNVPIVPVNHLEGHITIAAMSMDNSSYTSVLQKTSISGTGAPFEFPAIALLISGGHTELDLMEESASTRDGHPPRDGEPTRGGWPQFEMIGETRDDAIGEAFDKVARMMRLPYPGGPEISRLAAEARNSDVQSSEKLPRPMIHEHNFDFSFSGLKTAMLRLLKDRTLTEGEKLALAREFEDAAADVLVHKTMRAVEEYGAQTVLVGGGVSANTHIKSELKKALDELGVALFYPPTGFETDNALMIALAGYFHALKGEFIELDNLKANGNLRLGSRATINS